MSTSETCKKDGRSVKIVKQARKTGGKCSCERFTVEHRVMRVGTRYFNMCRVIGEQSVCAESMINCVTPAEKKTKKVKNVPHYEAECITLR